MSSGLYVKAKEAFLKGNIDLETDTIKVTLIDVADYTVDFTSHQFFSDVPSLARVATQTITSKTVVDGVFDATNTSFSAVTGDTVEAVIIWKDTGTEGSSALIAYIDSGLGLPFTPDGFGLTIIWPNGINKIFAIT